MDNGWIKLHRSLLKWEWHDDPNTFCLWVHLLLMANHDEQKWHGMVIPRGSLLTGRKKLAEETGLTEQSVRTSLTKLEKSQNLTKKSTNKFTLITICNYDTYQDTTTDYQPTNQPTTNQQLTNNQPTTNQQLTNNKEKEKKNPPITPYKENKKNIDINVDEQEGKNIITLTPARAREDEGINSVVSDDIEQMKERYRAELCGNTMANESARRIYGLTNEQLSQALDIFTDKLVVDGDTRKAYGEYRKYFGTWLKVNAKRIFFNQENNTASNGNRYQYTPGADLLNEVAEGFAAGM